MINDDGWCEDVWYFADNMDVCDPDVKSRNMPDFYSELAVELHLTLLPRLENLIDTRVRITKQKH